MHMKPAITNILFHGEGAAEGRSVTAILDDGHSVTITPLTSLGQKTFYQGGATMDRLRATVGLAQACVLWLHGDGPRPALRSGRGAGTGTGPRHGHPRGIHTDIWLHRR